MPEPLGYILFPQYFTNNCLEAHVFWNMVGVIVIQPAAYMSQKRWKHV